MVMIYVNAFLATAILLFTGVFAYALRRVKVSAKAKLNETTLFLKIDEYRLDFNKSMDRLIVIIDRLAVAQEEIVRNQVSTMDGITALISMTTTLPETKPENVGKGKQPTEFISLLSYARDNFASTITQKKVVDKLIITIKEKYGSNTR
jgi:hypothetical protein